MMASNLPTSGVANSIHTRVPPARVPALLPPRSLSRGSPAEAAGSDNPSTSTAGTRRQLLLGLSGLVAGNVLLPRNARAATVAAPFLVNNGAKGILAEEEEYLFRLRQEKEGEARRVLLEEKEKFETESRQTMEGKLCATPFGVDIVGITELIALIGALVGGVTARQRKDELERLNEQLRKINLSLRQQARAGTVYAPGLSYAPAMEGNGSGASGPYPTAPSVTPRAKPVNPHNGKTAAAVAVAAPTTALPNPQSITILSMEEDEMSSDQVQCRDALRAGKRLLKERNGAAAMVRFEKALMLSKALADKIQERRAMRGLAAAARLQGQYKSAIKYLERVLEISKAMHEYTGDADAYGTIADCYTDMGEFEKAAKFYDKYIDTMNRDGPV